MNVWKGLVMMMFACSVLEAGEPLIVAHRGASGEAPENTLPAFELAWKQGADAIEGDFHLTKDGRIVCIHDEDTEKVAGKRLVVRSSTLAELRGLDVGAWKGAEYKGARIPTIEEVFATVPAGKKIYVEVKADAGMVEKLIAAIRKSGLKEEQVVVVSFDAEVIRGLKSKAPTYKAYWLSGFQRDGIGRRTPSLRKVLSTLKRTGADGFSSGKDLVDRGFIGKLRAAGYEYHVWTVNDVKTAEKFKRWGAMSITTDVPAVIRAGE